MTGQEIKGMTIDEISEKIGLEKNLVKQYIDGPLKEDIEQERLDLGNGKYDPYILDLLIIQLEVDRAGANLMRTLEAVRKRKAA